MFSRLSEIFKYLFQFHSLINIILLKNLIIPWFPKDTVKKLKGVRVYCRNYKKTQNNS